MSLPSASPAIAPLAPEKPIFGVCTPGDCDSIYGKDAARAANPLHYVPFVSQVYEASTGDTGSAALKIMGGALLGGPIGLVAGLASAIFEQATGEGVGSAIASALRGDDEAPVQVAQAAPATAAYSKLNDVATASPAHQEILLPEKTAALSATRARDHAQDAPMKLASAIAGGGTGATAEDGAVLALFGSQAPSAHRSYQKAQMLPYLRDVSTSLVM